MNRIRATAKSTAACSRAGGREYCRVTALFRRGSPLSRAASPHNRRNYGCRLARMASKYPRWLGLHRPARRSDREVFEMPDLGPLHLPERHTVACGLAPKNIGLSIAVEIARGRY